MFNKLAEELKEARLKTDVTLQQMANKTRIDQKFLQAIEDGNFSFLPELYVKAFIKEYAKFVGLDANLILKKYEAARSGNDYVEKPPVTEESEIQEPPKEVKPVIKPQVRFEKPVTTTYDSTVHDTARETSSGGLNARKMIITAVATGVVVVIVLLYLFFFSNNTEIIVAEKPIDEIIENNTPRYVAPEEMNQTAADETGDSTGASFNTAYSDSLSLNIIASDTAWVGITLDGSNYEEFILFPNSRKIIKAARNYKIKFGRSSVIDLELNGRALQFNPGKNVTDVVIDNNGLKILAEPPSRPEE